MFSNVLSGALVGIDACTVNVEVVTSRGVPQILIVGLPDASINESRERVRASIKAAGYEVPLSKIVVNMAPADLRKEGSHFDLAIAIGILTSSGQCNPVKDFWLIGELSLNGMLKPCSGILPIVTAAKESGINNIIVPKENSKEGALVEGINVYSAGSLKEAVDILNGEKASREKFLTPVQAFTSENSLEFRGQDLKYVKGQYQAKRALEIAAAGGHNLLFVGEPGGGKSMLAQCLPSILPPLTKKTALEVTKIYSVAGLLKGTSKSVVKDRPFRAPHHSISGAGLIGGGSSPRPGEVSLAHHGVLFLDELAEFDKRTLDNLRQPIEGGEVVISRARLSVKYPARFLLIGACNPYTGIKQAGSRQKLILSEPLWDRFGLIVWVPPLKPDELLDFKPEEQESSEETRRRVVKAWERQRDRYEKLDNVFDNSSMTPEEIKKHCIFTDEASKLLRDATVSMSLTGRTYDHVLRTSRTIADLAGTEHIEEEHIAEAVQYRVSQESIVGMAV
ncbi:MAG TPA: YifB family Mg chelatase-like AAA ATPase [Vampirovibrionales bacterium]